MNNKNFLSIMTLSLMFFSACEKKEILSGKRENLFLDMRRPQLVNENISNLLVNLGEAVVLTSWVDIAGNKQHVGINHKMNHDFNVVWKTDIKETSSESIFANVVVFDGKIFAIDTGFGTKGLLYCINQIDGKLLWQKSICVPPNDGVYSSGLTANNGILYITTNTDMSVLALDIKTQKVIWERKDIKYAIGVSPIFVDNKLIVTVGMNEEQTLCLDSADGKTIWTKTKTPNPTTMFLSYSVAPAVSDEAIICTNANGEVTSLNIDSGAENWTETLYVRNISASGSAVQHIAVAPVVFDGKVLVIQGEPKMVLYDVELGKQIWEQDIGTFNQPAIFNNWGFVLSSKNELICLSMKNGDIKWKVSINSGSPDCPEAHSSMLGPVVVNGDIVLCDSAGKLTFYDAQTGVLKRQIMLNKKNIFIHPWKIFVIEKTMYILTARAIYALR